MKKKLTKKQKGIADLKLEFDKGLKKLKINPDEFSLYRQGDDDDEDDEEDEAESEEINQPKTEIIFSTTGLVVRANEDLKETEKTMMNLLTKFGKIIPTYCQ